jgi:glycine betaine/proline transport system ATP-binding protein
LAPDPLKLVSVGAWRLFGPDPQGFLASHGGSPSLETILEAGYISAVRGVDLEIKAGESFVVMGLSGCGKSTLVRCLAGITPLTSGEVRFDGRDLGGMSRAELIDIRRHKMGMVFQQFALLPHLTVLENVAFPLRIQGRTKAEQAERAHELVEIVGLKGRESYFPRQLSGGQQQRVGIARSLAVNPEVWFLDEPFSALDPLIRSEMQDEFLRLRSIFRTTIVFITHDLDEAVRLADRIAIMRDGEIIQIDTPEQLILNPVNSYVEEFTKRISRAKVLTVASLMTPGRGGGSLCVSSTARIAEVAEGILAASEPATVIDESQRVVGALDRESVIRVLADRQVG